MKQQEAASSLTAAVTDTVRHTLQQVHELVVSGPTEQGPKLFPNGVEKIHLELNAFDFTKKVFGSVAIKIEGPKPKEEASPTPAPLPTPAPHP